jgi:release factor glutamine methyltransferase
MKINSLIKKAKKSLKKQSPSPDLDVEILLSSILNKTREFILSNPEKEVSREKLKIFQKLLEKRKLQMPIAYLIGSKNFYGRSFFVSPDCLIPRPETEHLIEKTLEYCHKEIYPSKKTFVWDLGTGSGCVLITLAKELLKNPRFSAFQFLGTDISTKTLEIAKKNQKVLVPEIKIDFLKADLLDFVSKSYLKDLKNAQLVITANLPYLSKELYKNCPKSVLDFEPQKALLAEKQGLGLYFKLLKQIKIKKIDQLVWSLYLIFEISPEQREIAEKKLKEISPEAQYKFSKDFAGKWRFIEILL